jgi:hypothetical protein
MADWTTLASLSTAGGALVPAIRDRRFSSVRASPRAAGIAERVLVIDLLHGTRKAGGARCVG